jgi:hypothetical protein
MLLDRRRYLLGLLRVGFLSIRYFIGDRLQDSNNIPLELPTGQNRIQTQTAGLFKSIGKNMGTVSKPSGIGQETS